MSEETKPQVFAMPEQISAVMQAIPLLVELLPSLERAGRSKPDDKTMIPRLKAVVNTLGLVRDNADECRDIFVKSMRRAKAAGR